MFKYKLIILLFILFAAFILRAQRFDFPLSYVFAWGDGTRDYLVADHIIRYRELPLVGPYNLLYESGIRNSPIYFYLLALFLMPFNHILTLAGVNIILQLGVIVLVYLITKRIFDESSALAASAFFSFNPEIIKHADFIWQPYLMQPVALLALLFLLKGHIQKKYQYMVLALGLLILAISIHISAFSWLPAFLIICFYFLKKQKKRLKFYLGIIFAAVITFFVLYFPPIIFYLNSKVHNLFNLSLPLHAFSVKGYLENLFLNIAQFSKYFYLDPLPLVIFLFAGILLVVLSKNSLKSKNSFITLLLLFISSFAAAAFLNKVRIQYLIPSFVVLTILVAKIISQFHFPLRIALILSFVIIFSGNLSFIRDAKLPLENQKIIDDLTSAVLKKLVEVKRVDGFEKFDFFQIVSFAQDKTTFEYPTLDTILLVSLEKKLQRKLTAVSDKSPYNHLQINDKKYLVVFCFRFYQSLDRVSCEIHFKKSYPDYHLTSSFYNNDRMTVYLAKFAD